jgi:hypothetical protein
VKKGSLGKFPKQIGFLLGVSRLPEMRRPSLRRGTRMSSSRRLLADAQDLPPLAPCTPRTAATAVIALTRVARAMHALVWETFIRKYVKCRLERRRDAEMQRERGRERERERERDLCTCVDGLGLVIACAWVRRASEMRESGAEGLG